MDVQVLVKALRRAMRAGDQRAVEYRLGVLARYIAEYGLPYQGKHARG